jgi:formylglycine-generating enzyme required for sulfatase activity
VSAAVVSDRSDRSDKSDRSDQAVHEAAPESAAKPARSLIGFYVALGVVVALGLFGGWFWKTWTVWWFDADEAKRRQAAAAAKLGVPVEKSVDLGDGVKLELVLIPSGRFRMGSPASEKGREARKDDEKQHWVVITRPFYIGKREVSQEVWDKVMGSDGTWNSGPKHPVEGVSWEECHDFLKKLNAVKGEAAVFCLPTEAQWEWACRAGTWTRFCSGDEESTLGDYGWYDANAMGWSQPAGTRKPNAWDLFDMHGNVWEWCEDWYGEDYYVKSPRYDPTGPVTGPGRVLRGGAYGLSAGSCRSALRFEWGRKRNFVVIGVGFRVAAHLKIP